MLWKATVTYKNGDAVTMTSPLQIAATYFEVSHAMHIEGEFDCLIVPYDNIESIHIYQQGATVA